MAASGDGGELLPPGHRVGDWIVEEPIGAGGWATVYAGRPAHPGGAGGTAPGQGPPAGYECVPNAPHVPRGAAPHGAGRGLACGTAGADQVALKIMPTAGLSPRQARTVAEAARREVSLARTAPHPRLVRLLDTLVLSTPDRPALDGAIVLVMERARCSLRDLLDTGVDETRGGRIIAGICEGLAHLHRAGWVHTDLKPENILIGRDGEVRLSDFGFAIELTGTHGYSPPMGTLDYLPPERWKEPLGERGVRVRATADIWALGIVVHEVFAAGVSPFPGATPTARSAAVQEYAEGRTALRMDHGVPEFWRALAADCLAPTHTARGPHTAESLLARIRAHEAGRRPRRLPRLRIALLALSACAVAGAAALWCYPGAGADGAGEGPARVRVFNAERGCQDRADHDPQCSLGLAIDPLLPYTARNVVTTRVWHGDLLEADCQLPEGQPIIDEEDIRSTLWFRVRVPPPHRTEGTRATGHADVRGAATAWLPAVRTRDRPALPRCAQGGSPQVRAPLRTP
ncbi:serine/threonine-protein kinase [Streptomyces sp. SP18CS02]|uniref:serine/threonine-protein kinase n=1 Tax=Streptomyces sp. SP18CS02 TaxID=3002531 RepID=UPI002E774EB3|nr:serine/threonine-protein kinase [Streptomyces sp. SP18CS02]MEE1751940.1 serine/threonine-protein kinase [Streptomyces sp. SP18CS02]